MAEQQRRRRRRAATWAARCGSGSTRPTLRRGLASSREAYGDGRGRASGTGTATRSTTPTATSSSEAGLVFSGTSPDGRLVEFVELPARRAPVLRRHPGPPGAAVAARPAPHPLFAGLVGGRDRPAGASCRFPIDESGAAPPRADERRRADGGTASSDLARRAGRVARRPADGPSTAATGAARCAADDRRGARTAEASSTAEVVEHPGAVGGPGPRRRRAGARAAASTGTRSGTRLVELPGRAARRRGRGPAGRGRGASCARRPRCAADGWTLLVDAYYLAGALRRDDRAIYLARGLSAAPDRRRLRAGARGGRHDARLGAAATTCSTAVLAGRRHRRPDWRRRCSRYALRHADWRTAGRRTRCAGRAAGIDCARVADDGVGGGPARGGLRR